MEPAVYGRLIVTGPASHVAGRPALMCRCECGETVAIQRKRLFSGHTQSCGCLQRQRARENMAPCQQPTHGMTGTHEYRAWIGMRSRVTYTSSKGSERYVGRGIVVCAEWFESFEVFLQDVGPAPSAEHSIDRIDNDGNYEPSNVHWATSQQQNRNKSDNVIVQWRGRRMPLAEAVESSGLPYQTVWSRIQRAGWDAERALTTPVRQ